MLGLIRGTPSRRWFAAGKHRCAGDFFRLGRPFPLAAGLAAWLDDGYRRGSPGVADAAPVSWRFWARGGERDRLAYGIMEDSCDSHGRPHPLLVLGEGELPGWEERWQLVPEALFPRWEGLRQALDGECGEVGGLEERLRAAVAVPPALPPLPEGDGDPPPGELRRLVVEALSRHAAAIVFAFDREGLSMERALRYSHAVLKEHGTDPPAAVFAGGGGDPRIVILYRPLASADFPRLWWGKSGERNGT